MAGQIAVVDGYYPDDFRSRGCLADLSPSVQPNVTVVKDTLTKRRFLLHGSDVPEKEAEIQVSSHHLGLTIRAIVLVDGRVFIRDHDVGDENYPKTIPALAQQAKEYFNRPVG